MGIEAENVDGDDYVMVTKSDDGNRNEECTVRTITENIDYIEHGEEIEGGRIPWCNILCGIWGGEDKVDTEVEHEAYDQMYQILEKAAGIAGDKYRRIISPFVVNQFCLIAKEMGIKLDDMGETEFDEIYRTYAERRIEQCGLESGMESADD